MYVKVFSQILESSIAVDYEQRHIFQDLLIIADREGVIDMTHEAIARRLNVPERLVTEKIAQLEQPDPKSRSDEHEGRRLIRLADHRDWGWKVVNYAFYRDLIDVEALRAANCQRKREQRAREKAKKQAVPESHNGHSMSQPVRDLSRLSQKVTLSESVSVSKTNTIIKNSSPSQFVTRERIAEYIRRKHWNNRLIPIAAGKLMGGKYFGQPITDQESFQDVMETIYADWKPD